MISMTGVSGVVSLMLISVVICVTARAGW